MKSRAPKITETQEHKVIADWFRKVGLADGAMAIHIRNERGSAWERMQAKHMGILSGIPDWLIVYAGTAGFIELKPRGWKRSNAKYTPHEIRQLATHDRLRKSGCWVEICETLEEVLETLKRHGVPCHASDPMTRSLQAILSQPGTEE